MPDVSRRKRAIAIAKAEKTDTREKLFLAWIATLSAGLAALYAISLFIG